ncbi:MAG: AAA family ATPase [bacterium]|nr:AAA family ATPase [bacterium]
MSVLGNIDKLAADNIRLLKLPDKKISPSVAILFVGIPGSGKSTLATKLSEDFPLALISDEQMAHFLFTTKSTLLEHSQKESLELASKTIEKLVQQGYSCVYDSNVKNRTDREVIRDLVAGSGGKFLLINLQVEEELAFERVSKANFAVSRGEKKGFILDKDLFQYEVSSTQMPLPEEQALVFDSSGQNYELLKEQVEGKLKQ